MILTRELSSVSKVPQDSSAKYLSEFFRYVVFLNS